MPERPNNLLEVLFKSAGSAVGSYPDYNQQSREEERKRQLMELEQTQFQFQKNQAEMAMKQSMLQRLQQQEDPEQVFWYKYGNDLSKAPEGDVLRFAPQVHDKYFPSAIDKEKTQREKELHQLKLQQIRANIAKTLAGSGEKAKDPTALWKTIFEKRLGQSKEIPGKRDLEKGTETKSYKVPFSIEESMAAADSSVAPPYALPEFGGGNKSMSIEEVDALIKQLEQQVGEQ